MNCDKNPIIFKAKTSPPTPSSYFACLQFIFRFIWFTIEIECVYIVKMFVLLLAFLLLLLLFSLLRLVFPSLSSMSRHIDDVTDIY